MIAIHVEISFDVSKVRLVFEVIATGKLQGNEERKGNEAAEREKGKATSATEATVQTYQRVSISLRDRTAIDLGTFPFHEISNLNIFYDEMF